jgi:hypothetical protein
MPVENSPFQILSPRPGAPAPGVQGNLGTGSGR